MLIDLLFHPDYTKKEKLLFVLFFLGMADRFQLAETMNCSVHNIDRMIKAWNHKLPPANRYILARRPARNRPRMYYLGPRGWTQVMQWLEEDRQYYGKKKKTASHYRGINEIFLRLVRRIGHDQLRDRLRWYSSQEAREIMIYPWSLARAEEWKDPKVKEEEQQLITRPDARAVIDGRGFWIEYDNGTKREAPIKEQFRRYIESLSYLPAYTNVRNPVIWVVPDEKRRRQMKEWWSTVKHEPNYEGLDWIPEMHFFVAGEETDFLLESVQQAVSSVG